MGDIVEDRWLQLIADADDPSRTGRSVFVRPYAEMLRIAHAHPQLKLLFPWTGMWELHFSRCTEQRWTWDIPYIAPARDGLFLVSGPSRTQCVGYADSAEAAVGIVAARLPPGCGRAFIGTPQELAACERGSASG